MSIFKAPPPPPPPAAAGVWKWTFNGDRKCSNCGMLEPNCFPGGGAIYDDEKRYCFYCGTRLFHPDELE